jgi:hypothetical protein
MGTQKRLGEAAVDAGARPGLAEGFLLGRTGVWIRQMMLRPSRGRCAKSSATPSRVIPKNYQRPCQQHAPSHRQNRLLYRKTAPEGCPATLLRTCTASDDLSSATRACCRASAVSSTTLSNSTASSSSNRCNHSAPLAAGMNSRQAAAVLATAHKREYRYHMHINRVPG